MTPQTMAASPSAARDQAPGLAAGAGAAEAAEVVAADDDEQRPERQRQRSRQDALEHPDGDGEEQDAEQGLDRRHPGPGMRQETPAGDADEQQRRAHADAPSQTAPAHPRSTSPVCPITASAATIGGATQAVTTSAESAPMIAVPTKLPDFCRPEAPGEARLERRRDLEVEQAEHREREHHEQRGEGDDDPGLLEERLGLLAGGREGGAGDRVGQGHAEHVDHRQQERAPRRRRRALAGDDAGQDRDHRQHAGREGEQQAEAEESRHDDQQAPAGDQSRKAVLLGDHRRTASRGEAVPGGGRSIESVLVTGG